MRKRRAVHFGETHLQHDHLVSLRGNQQVHHALGLAGRKSGGPVSDVFAGNVSGKNDGATGLPDADIFSWKYLSECLAQGVDVDLDG